MDRHPDRRRTQSLRHVEQTLAEGRVLAVRYRDMHGTESRREVDPVLLASADGNWYLVARCRTAGAIRWFRLDRIAAANLTGERAEQVSVESVGSPPSTARALSDL
ncbi:MAG: helix-turn-helix transcriptional regulator [Phycicoccus sp.]